MAPGTVTLLRYMIRMMAWANICSRHFVVYRDMFHVKHIPVKHISRRIFTIRSMYKKRAIPYDILESVKPENW